MFLRTAYSHVRTEPQSVIGQTRGKKTAANLDDNDRLYLQMQASFAAMCNEPSSASQPASDQKADTPAAETTNAERSQASTVPPPDVSKPPKPTAIDTADTAAPKTAHALTYKQLKVKHKHW
jgi:hypothetical protein